MLSRPDVHRGTVSTDQSKYCTIFAYVQLHSYVLKKNDSDQRALSYGSAWPGDNTLTVGPVVQPDQAGRMYHIDALAGSLNARGSWDV